MAQVGRNSANSASATAQALTHAIDEVLSAFASVPVRARVIERALALGGQRSLPTDPAALEQFVTGPLREAIEGILGPTTSGLVLEQLEPLVSRARVRPSPAVSGVVRSPARGATTVAAMKRSPPQAPEMRPTLRVDPSRVRAVAMSPDAEARLRLAAALGPGALVVATLDALWDALRAVGGERTVVIVDLRLTRTASRQLEQLRDRGPLVLWGGRERLSGAVPCAVRETPEQVAALVTRLLDDSSGVGEGCSSELGLPGKSTS